MARRINIKKRVRDGKTKYTAMYYLPDGSLRSAGTFTSRKKAEHEAEVAWDKSRTPGWADPEKGKATLATYAEEKWLPNLLIERKTWMGYESVYRVHIKAAFGERALASILPSDIEGWLNKMEQQGVGRSTQRKAYVLLNNILKKARRDLLVPMVATEGIKTRPVPKLPVRIFSHSQWEKFIGAVPEKHRALLAVGIATGLRPSELRALCPAQINWARQVIVVDRGLVEGSIKKVGARFIEKAYPKGKVSREVSCDKATLKLLAKEIVARGLAKDSQEPIFLVHGKPFGSDLMLDVFKAARDEAEIDANLTMKHLRSSRASWLAKETGGDVVRVQRELGHQDIETTMKYLAVVDEVETDSASSFEDFLKEEEG